MLRKIDLVTVGLAVVVHVGLGLTVVRAGKSPPPPRPKPVLLQFERRPEPPPAPPVAAAPAARAPSVRRVALGPPRPVAARPQPEVRAPEAPAARPSAPSTPAPAYAVAMASTMAVAAVALPSGVPGGGGHGTGVPGTAASSSRDGAGDGYRPASAREVGSMPEVDADACGRAAVYPREAEQGGVEGDVRLRVALNEQGQVHAVRVLSGLGRGLDAAAIDAIKNRCKFKPAIGRDGQPVAFVIESYKFHFELPR